MSNTSLLYLKEFRCVVETDEGGNDSPYFLVFVGNRHGPPKSDTLLVRMPAWDGEAYSGKLFTPNLWVSDQVDTDSLVLVALMEEDWDPDIAGSTLATLKAMMQARWAIYGSWTITADQRAYLARSDFNGYIEDLRANDEFIQSRRLNISTEVGDLPLLNFYGDGGHYRVRFYMKSTLA